MDDTPDDELVRRIGDGGAAGRAAEDALCRRFAPRLRIYGLRHLRDEDRARDLVQSVLVAVIVAARGRRISEADKLSRFVLGTARHLALQARERDGRVELAGDEALAGAAALAAPASEVTDWGVLLRCLHRLDERAKAVVILSFHDEQPAEAIAARLATTAANVRVLRHRAVVALRRCMDAKEVA
jgi:RNA polymerase sigma-70 factor (ECF subfamily)